MNLTSGIVLFAVTWFLTFYIVLMLRTRTQAEAGEIDAEIWNGRLLAGLRRALA